MEEGQPSSSLRRGKRRKTHVLSEFTGKSGLGDSESYSTSEELSERSHAGSLAEKARGVAELDLHREERVLHGDSNSDTSKDLIANNVGVACVFVNGVEETGANREEGRSSNEERPIATNNANDATRDNDGKDSAEHECEDVDSRLRGRVLASDLVEDGKVCAGEGVR